MSDARRPGPGSPTRGESPLERAALALSQGRALDVLALSRADGERPGPEETDRARRSLVEGAGGDCEVALVSVDGGEPVTALLHLHAGSPDPRASAQRAATAARLCGGLATSSAAPDATPADLATVAIEGLLLARNEGAGRAVHSELYDLVRLGSARREVSSQNGGEGWIPRPAARDAEAPRLPSRPVIARPAAARPEDDPFASDARDVLVPHAAADRLTSGIAPDLATLAALERTSTAEAEALRGEIETLRAELEQLRRGDAQVRTLLERRIAKVSHQLEESELEVARLRAALEADPGVASVHREVQGLDASDPAADTKRRMLDGVLEANRSRTSGEAG